MLEVFFFFIIFAIQTDKYMEVIKRTGDLALVKAKNYKKQPKDYYEIVHYQPNTYYGRENEFEKDGEFYYKDPEYSFCRIHESRFVNKESCYSIGIFSKDEEGYDFRSVGNRIVLPDDEWVVLGELIQHFYKKIARDYGCE
jgi:hypothetical protein